ncbi:MAG TPA: hypothetical protein VMM16_05700 [Verrucomicrobiae bacterium]|nr:hypothetical protein [Verrucomicrobiae bacterium]
MNLTRMAARVCWVVMMAAVLGLCGVARAQEAGAPPPPPPGPPGHRGFGPGPMSDEMMGFVGFEAGLGGKVVTGAPFTATISTRSTQVLADGNQINRSSTGTIARDSQGRTRRDMTLAGIGPLPAGQTPPHVVLIRDNVAGTQYVLEPDRKIARQVGRPRHGGRGADGPPPQGDVSWRRNQNDVTTTPLGQQTINGIPAEGTRTTRTIPAGAVGNEKPIVITSERWYSSELQTVVMLKRSDPYVGESEFQLTNIQRSEPDASLFQVPAGYSVRAAVNDHGQGRHRRGPGGPPAAVGPDAPPPPPQD